MPIDLFTGAHLEKHPVRTIPTHEVEKSHDGDVPGTGEIPPTLLEELRTLGYVD